MSDTRLTLDTAWIIVLRTDLYWAPNERGYTSELLRAGVYSREHAEYIQQHTRRGDEPRSLRDELHRLHLSPEAFSASVAGIMGITWMEKGAS